MSGAGNAKPGVILLSREALGASDRAHSGTQNRFQIDPEAMKIGKNIDAETDFEFGVVFCSILY